MDKNSLYEIIENSMKNIKSLSEKAGMTENSFNMLLGGEEIKDCPYCETFNLYEVSYNEKNNWSMYECGSCEKSWYVDWEKNGEKFKLKKD
jgi:transposase-like protein|tara:strand:- start:21 stop:293 length:273 start_codon:yes stop_codon:yes gene_type:complete